MKFRHRHQLIELHEQPWMPSIIQNIFREALAWVEITFRAYDNFAPIHRRWLERIGAKGYIDLCSGSGDLSVSMFDRLRSSGMVCKMKLSDLYPHRSAYQEHVDRLGSDLSYIDQPWDATKAPSDKSYPARTIFSAFHHFSPQLAVQILKNAADEGDGILIAEAYYRDFRHFIAISGIFIFAPWFPFFRKKFSWRVLLWSLIIPIMPILFMVDGAVSVLRGYTEEELLALTRSIDNTNYNWEVGRWRYFFVLKGVYLMGWPKPQS